MVLAPPPLPNPFPYVSYPGSPIRSLCTENTQNWHWNKRNLQRKCCPVFSFFKQTQHSCGFELSRNLALLPNKWLHFSWTKNLNWRLACWSHNSTFGKENGMCNIFPSNGIKKKKKRKKETFVWQLWKQLSLSRAEGEIKMQMMSFT